jgi:DNA polymerase I-like protein with 3'-5' exonuclease and polymerase domains
VRKTINLQNIAKNHIFDPEEATEEQLRQMEELQAANERVNQGLEDEIKRLGMRIQAELSEIVGQYHDEISLLNQVGGVFF